MHYKDILSSDYFWDTYSQIEYIKQDFPVNHGFVHINNVLKWAKRLAEFFGLSEEEKEILLISATLHDIGYLNGREDHPLSGAEDARVYLQDKLPNDTIDKVCNAIAKHGGDNQEDYMDNITMCLILSDKFDFDKTRYRLDPNYDSTKLFTRIEKVELEKEGEELNLNVYTPNTDISNELQESYFIKKLNKRLNTLYETRNIKINIKFLIIDRQ